jgi:hypothetical protein
MALSAEQILVIRNYVTELQRTNPNNWVNDLAAAMDQFDVSPSMLQEAYSDISVSQIQDTYNQSRPSGKFSTARPQDVGPPSPRLLHRLHLRKSKLLFVRGDTKY